MKDKQFNSDWNFLHITSKYLLPLTREQLEFLKILDQKTWAKDFLLTGGTPLAKLFLGHRESDDLDLFLIPKQTFPRKEIKKLAQELGVKFLVVDNIRYILTFSSKFKVKLVKNSLFNFDLSTSFVLPGFNTIKVAGLKDMLLQKIISLVDRADPKDYADVLFCFKKMHVSPQDLRNLVKVASDRAYTWDVEIYFSATLRSKNWLNDFDKIEWKVSVDKKELIELSEKLAEAYEEAWKKELEQFQKETKISCKLTSQDSNKQRALPDLLLWDYKELPDDPEVRVRRLLMTFPYSFMHFRKQDVQYVEKHRDRLFKDEDPRFAILWDSMKKRLFPEDWWS